MSLRDQLLAKGLVSKKDVRKANQDLRKKRREGQGARKKKRQLKAEKAAAQAAAKEARDKARLEQRQAHEYATSEREHELRVEQIIRGSQLGSRGKASFYHKDAEGRFLLRLSVSEGVAHLLRVGEAAVATLREKRGSRYFIIRKKAAQKLYEVEPTALVHYVEDTKGLSDPSERLAEPKDDWYTPDLRARRATAADVDRFVGQTSPKS
ncbi:MAG: DUF2058 family protein [Proteobacteria bacterium]|nr:DUF2058 family protein [Pseudomonadota bacterium]